MFNVLALCPAAVAGVSHLVAASFHEDAYGVIQKSLPDILTLLLSLLEVCVGIRFGCHQIIALCNIFILSPWKIGVI